MPPLKPINITDRILYNSNNAYNMASIKMGKYLGRIKLVPKKDTLYIADINSRYRENKELRVGTSLINFAKKMGKKMGLNLEVDAYNYEYGGKPSPQFFRKQGFTTKDKRKDDLLDFTIEYGIDIPPDMKQGITMYYTPRG